MKKVQLDRLPIDSPEAADRIRRGEPFVSHVEWPAMKRWSPAYLAERVVPKQVTLWEKTAAGRTRIDVPFARFVEIIFDPNWGERYEIPGAPQTRVWFDGKPDPNLGVLLEDMIFPPLVDQARLFGITLFPGTGGFDAGMHYDGNGMVNLNVQVFGRKHWHLFAPRFAGFFEAVTVLEPTMTPPFIQGTTRHPLECASTPGYDEVVCHEAELGPGDVIFVPAFWMHWVVYGPEATLGCNFWWHREGVALTGPSAAQALVNALLTVYRRRMPGATLMEVCAEMNRLPLEARELLRDIEQTLISDTRLMESPSMFLGLRRDDNVHAGGQLVAGHFEKVVESGPQAAKAQSSKP